MATPAASSASSAAPAEPAASGPKATGKPAGQPAEAVANTPSPAAAPGAPKAPDTKPPSLPPPIFAPILPLGRNSGTGGAWRQHSDLWSEAEDELLRQGVAKHGGKNWKSIADGLPDKTALQCMHRWRKVLDPEVNKGPWLTAEDDKIRELVSAHGPQKWSAIAKELPGRIGKQCRERWYNRLDPNIKTGPWTNAEVRAPVLLVSAKALMRYACAGGKSHPGPH